MPAVSSPFTIPLHNREKTRGAGRHRLSKEQIRSAAIFFQKIACLHDGIGATACSCASSVTFGVAVPQTLDEWRTRLRSLAPPAGSEPLCVSNSRDHIGDRSSGRPRLPTGHKSGRWIRGHRSSKGKMAYRQGFSRELHVGRFALNETPISFDTTSGTSTVSKFEHLYARLVPVHRQIGHEAFDPRKHEIISGACPSAALKDSFTSS